MWLARLLSVVEAPVLHRSLRRLTGSAAILLDMPTKPAIGQLPFESIYRHGYVRVAAAVPRVRIGDPVFNAEHTVELARQADEQAAALIVFPELGLTAYTADDLFHQDALLDATLEAIEQIRIASERLTPVIVVGAPLRSEQGVFNAAVIVHSGRVLGAVPKSYLPEYREFYEKRQFRAARDLLRPEIDIDGVVVPFGNDLLFSASDISDFTLHVEICEDLWAPIPPSTYGALAGATVLANLSASNITVGKSEYRHVLCAGHSARTIAAYIYTAAGRGESTTDMAWDGQAMIYENGDRLVEAQRYPLDDHLICADIDLDRLASGRAEQSSWGTRSTTTGSAYVSCAVSSSS